MPVPMAVKRVLRRTPLYPVYLRFAPSARDARDRSRRRLAEWGRALRGQAPLPPLLPPPSLFFLVTGTTDVDWFVNSGRMGAESIGAILEKNGLSIARMGAILDFGCGVGRVLRHWSDVQGPVLHGTDYNPELIRWCQRNLRFARYNVNALTGPLSYASGTFDFIYALSVFTHLTPEQQDEWMAELRRILKPRGHLLISVSGEHHVHMLSGADLAAYRAGHRVTIHGEHAGTNTCATYHPPSSVRGQLAAEFEVVDFVEEGAKGNPWQDYWLLRKPA
jgi:SAM-dependent methyltransferase